MSCDLASEVICGDGSDPIERIHIKGVLGSDSSQVASKSKILASPYSSPREAENYVSNISINVLNIQICF